MVGKLGSFECFLPRLSHIFVSIIAKSLPPICTAVLSSTSMGTSLEPTMVSQDPQNCSPRVDLIAESYGQIARSLPGILFMTNILEPLKILFILEPLERLFCSTKSLSVGWKLECKPKVKCPYKFITRNSAAFGHAFPCARRPK